MPGRHEHTDAAWALLAPLPPTDALKGEKWAADQREVIDATLFPARRRTAGATPQAVPSGTHRTGAPQSDAPAAGRPPRSTCPLTSTRAHWS
ncbi:transposase [Nocardiopsis sp. L17-MgMaSL7]|uniref:transposase n=1 Tax=Nocardiopsis sp. L17-MgMaSL7 TaxID=1938893 RepID=UPI0011B550A2|nr:transposase [Nocardiopsis sp. L17-MgMaSL7]